MISQSSLADAPELPRPINRVAANISLRIAVIAVFASLICAVMTTWVMVSSEISSQVQRVEQMARDHGAQWVAAATDPEGAAKLREFINSFQLLPVCAIGFIDHDGRKLVQRFGNPAPREGAPSLLGEIIGHECGARTIVVNYVAADALGGNGTLLIDTHFDDLVFDPLRHIALVVGTILLIASSVAGASIILIQRQLGTPIRRLASSLSAIDPSSPTDLPIDIRNGGKFNELDFLLLKIRQMLRANAAHLAERNQTEQRMTDFFAASSDFFMEFDRRHRLGAFGNSSRARTVVAAFASAYKEDAEGKLQALEGADRQWRELLETARNQKPFRNFMLSIPRTSGDQVLYFSLSAVPIFDDKGDFCGHRAALTDVTQSVIAQQRIEEERRFIEKAYDVMPARLLVVNLRFEIIYANQRMAAQLGREFEELIGRRIHDILPDMRHDGVAVRDLMLADMRRALEENRPSFGIERQHVTPDGHIETALYDCVPFHDNAGAPLGLLVLATPISERKAIENNLRLANAQLEQQARDLQHLAEEYARERQMAYAANRAKSDFLANMSHELRTPLNAVIGFAELIAKQSFGPIAPRYKEYAEDIVFSARHLLSIISDILDMSKLEAGRYVINPQASEAAYLIEGAVRMLQVRASNAGVALTTDFSANLPELMVDARAVRQILVNLIGNAVKFTRAGGSVTVITRGAINGGVDMVVTDTGIGIKAEDHTRLFEPFWQAEGAHVKTFEGTGLGLSICRRLIDLHGGTIEIESEFGVGTTVTVHFPPSCVVGRAEASDLAAN